jgi:hypothetical protein
MRCRSWWWSGTFWSGAAIGAYLRACALSVIEAILVAEARAVLLSGALISEGQVRLRLQLFG